MTRRVPLKAKTPLIRKAPLNAQSKSDSARLRRKIDRLAGQAIRSTGVCLACGWVTENEKVYLCSSRMECAHILTRGHLKIRHHPANLTCLCNIHHRYFTQHPAEWEKFIESVYPGRFDWLYQLRRDPDYEGMEYWLKHWQEEAKKI